MFMQIPLHRRSPTLICTTFQEVCSGSWLFCDVTKGSDAAPRSIVAPLDSTASVLGGGCTQSSRSASLFSTDADWLFSRADKCLRSELCDVDVQKTIRLDDEQLQHSDPVFLRLDFNPQCLDSLFPSAWKGAELRSAASRAGSRRVGGGLQQDLSRTSTASFRRGRFQTSQTDVKLFWASDLFTSGSLGV